MRVLATRRILAKKTMRGQNLVFILNVDRSQSQFYFVLISNSENFLSAGKGSHCLKICGIVNVVIIFQVYLVISSVGRVVVEWRGRMDVMKDPALMVQTQTGDQILIKINFHHMNDLMSIIMND